jgi:hypothetical protein
MNLTQFIGKSQLSCMRSLCRGEEGEHFKNKIAEIKNIIATMPKTYETEGQENKKAFLHYFHGGSDWYIVERDAGLPDDEEQGVQRQAYGFTCLNGDKENAEWGYIAIDELIECGVELDLYYTPESVEVIKQRFGKYSEEDTLDDDKLEEFMEQGYCYALDGCTVEFDGHCPHGSPSVVLSAGLI